MKLSKNVFHSCLILAFFALGTSLVQAGNPDRRGSAGAGQLLINPWTRSSGLANSNMASISGVESIFNNVGSLATLKKTELVWSTTNYLSGADIKINSLAFGQRLGSSGILGLSVSSMNFGDIQTTTTDNPEGSPNIFFSPNFTTIGVSLAKEFSNSISGGFTLKVISEAISNVKAQGVAFDAGIKYVTGERDQIHFGIALQNVGPAMKYSGDGLTITSTINATSTSITMEQRSAKYELPSSVNIGAAYDFLISETSTITASAQFISNSFTYDQFAVGALYSLQNKFILRAGYNYENEIFSDANRQTVNTGLSAGVTLQIPAGSNGAMLGVDYSYRDTKPFSGIHSIGLHITL